MIEDNLKANYLVSGVFFKSEFKTHAYAPKNVKKVVDLFLYGQKTDGQRTHNFSKSPSSDSFCKSSKI